MKITITAALLAATMMHTSAFAQTTNTAPTTETPTTQTVEAPQPETPQYDQGQPVDGGTRETGRTTTQDEQDDENDGSNATVHDIPAGNGGDHHEASNGTQNGRHGHGNLASRGGSHRTTTAAHRVRRNGDYITRAEFEALRVRVTGLESWKRQFVESYSAFREFVYTTLNIQHRTDVLQWDRQRTLRGNIEAVNANANAANANAGFFKILSILAILLALVALGIVLAGFRRAKVIAAAAPPAPGYGGGHHHP